MSSPEPKPLEVVEDTKPVASKSGRGGGLRKMFWVAAFALVLLAIAALGTTGYLGQREMRGRVDALQGELETTRTTLASAEEALAGERARAEGLQSTLGRVNVLSQQLAASLEELQALTSGAAASDAPVEEPDAAGALPAESAVDEVAPADELEAVVPEAAPIESTLEGAADAVGGVDTDPSSVVEALEAPVAVLSDEPAELASDKTSNEEAPASSPDSSTESSDVAVAEAELVAPELDLDLGESVGVVRQISLPDSAPSILDGDNPLEASGALEISTPLENELPLEAGELVGVREEQSANTAPTNEIPRLVAAPPVSDAPAEATPSLWTRVVEGIRGLAPSD